MLISNYMRDEHRSCDESFAKAEQAASGGDFDAAFRHFEDFMVETLRHFSKEEEILFPAFEETTGNTEGPTMVMRHEHTQIRGLLEQMKEAIDSKDKDRFFSVADTLMILLQQHNMKEEQMLYAMCDRLMGERAETLVNEMKER
ncbi:putative protein [Hydrogenimonas sp.]|nr:putative protein [Hydrogenimonas sp.]